MYRLLVVDDEEIITDSLANMLSGLDNPVLEVSKAYSAPEALELLNRYVFDIVISDIQMPGKSGIYLLQEIHSKWPSCSVIFLTGHDEFEYACQALKYGAFRFILKNDGDEVLLEAIRDCVQEIQRKKLVKPDAPVLHIEEINLQHRQQGFLSKLLVDGSITRQDMHLELENLEIKLDINLPLLLLVGKTDTELKDTLLDGINWIFKEKVAHAVTSHILRVDKTMALWLMQPAEKGNQEHAAAAVTGLAESIQESCAASLDANVTFVFDAEYVNWQELPNRFAKMRYVTNRYLESGSGIALAKMNFFSEESILFYDAGTEQPGRDAGEESGMVFIERLQKYIRDNLDADLSLTALSEHVFLNPAYLSRRYKELTGNNITDYILDMRMEKAADMIVNSSRKIGSIALLVGYKSAANFSRVFKKIMGETPQEYRDSHTII